MSELNESVSREAPIERGAILGIGDKISDDSIDDAQQDRGREHILGPLEQRAQLAFAAWHL